MSVSLAPSLLGCVPRTDLCAWLWWLGDGCSGLGHSGPSLVGCEKGVRGGGAGVRVNALYNGCVVIMPIFSVA